MRSIIWLLLILAQQALATNFNFVQTIGSGGVGGISTLSVTFASSNTAGNIIAVYISNGTPSASGVSVSDSQGNTYRYLSGSVVGSSSAIWVALRIKSGANTVTVNAASSIAASEYSSTSAAVAAIGGAVQNSPRSTNPFAGPACFRSTSEVMVLIGAYDYGGYVVWALSSGTVRANIFEVGGQGVMAGDDDVSSVAANYYNSFTNPTRWSSTATAYLYLTTGTTVCGATPSNPIFRILQ